MRIVIPANGADLDAPISPVFGRCANFIVVDTETNDADTDYTFEVHTNPALASPSGAGVQAAQFVLQQGAQAILSANLGPNAFRILQSAGVPVYELKGATVREAVEAFKAEELTLLTTPGPGHVGLGRGRRQRHGR
jgi:predicted Fe-Mo cluster-binding NifX family protein